LPGANTFEVEIAADLEGAAGLSLEISDLGAGSEGIPIRLEVARFQVAGSEAPVEFVGKERKVKLSVFLDRSVLEVFVNNSLCVTKTVRPFNGSATLKISGQGGPVRVEQIRAWSMRTIW
jgi:sucrose-6-phosphate hydrolase SacC (GH32 family)